MIKVVDPIKSKVCSNIIVEFQIPKSNKTAGAEKIYEREGYIILRVKRGYIVYNTKKNFKNGHTHIQSFSKAARAGKEIHFSPIFKKQLDQFCFINIIEAFFTNLLKVFNTHR